MRRNAVHLAVLLLCALMLLGGCATVSGRQESKGPLRVGLRPDILDFSYRNEKTGRYYGLEIDLARELARRLGCEDIEVVPVTSQTREDVLVSGEADCVIACFSVTEERKKRLDFSTPYYTDSLRVMVENSSMIRTVRGLRGCTIAVLRTANAQALATLAFEETGLFTGEYAVRFAPMDTYDEMSSALESGLVDAMCMDGSIAWGYYEDDRSYVDMKIGAEPYAVATMKGSALSAPIDEAVCALLDEGFMDELVEKWL